MKFSDEWINYYDGVENDQHNDNLKKVKIS